MTETPLIPLSAVSWVGEGLARPECVLTTAKGEVFVGDHHAGIAEIGKPKRRITGAPPGFLPNGVAMGLLLCLSYATLVEADILRDPGKTPAPEVFQVTSDLPHAPPFQLAEQPRETQFQ